MPDSSGHIDYHQLFVAVSNGDEAAFKTLFALFRSKAYAVGMKWTKSPYAAEEITQNVFINIWVSRARLPMVNDPEAYLYSVIYNRVSQYLKNEANQSAILSHFGNSRQYSNETEESIYAAECQKYLDSAIAQLSPQRKIIYELTHMQGKSYNEIAEALNISRNTVKTHLVKAVKFIRNYMRENVLFFSLVSLSLLSVFRVFFASVMLQILRS